MGWVVKLKEKWGVKSNFDFIMIMLSFSLAGSMISVCRPPIFHFLGITSATPMWEKVLIYIPMIPPIYQVFLMIFGTILGQFNFFWEKEKKLGRFFVKAFSKATGTLRRT